MGWRKVPCLAPRPYLPRHIAPRPRSAPLRAWRRGRCQVSLCEDLDRVPAHAPADAVSAVRAALPVPNVWDGKKNRDASIRDTRRLGVAGSTTPSAPSSTASSWSSRSHLVRFILLRRSNRYLETINAATAAIFRLKGAVPR